MRPGHAMVARARAGPRRVPHALRSPRVQGGILIALPEQQLKSFGHKCRTAVKRGFLGMARAPRPVLDSCRPGEDEECGHGKAPAPAAEGSEGRPTALPRVVARPSEPLPGGRLDPAAAGGRGGLPGGARAVARGGRRQCWARGLGAMAVRPEGVEDWCQLMPNLLTEADWTRALETEEACLSHLACPWGA